MRTEDLAIMFNQEILKIKPRIPGLQEAKEFELSIVQLKEEIGEFEDAYEDHDLVGCVDAMIDLKVFADGVLYKMGLLSDDIYECALAISNANMSKKLGVKATRVVVQSGEAPADANKPIGWVGPEAEISRILTRRAVLCQ